MQPKRPQFSMPVHFYLVVFFVLLTLSPICLVTAIPGQHSLAFCLVPLIWPLAIAASALFANRLCSSERMRYRDGLLWITASMMTGWLYISFLTTLPVLLFAFSASVLLALRGKLANDAEYSQRQWHRLVAYFFRHRMKP